MTHGQAGKHDKAIARAYTYVFQRRGEYSKTAMGKDFNNNYVFPTPTKQPTAGARGHGRAKPDRELRDTC